MCQDRDDPLYGATREAGCFRQIRNGRVARVLQKCLEHVQRAVDGVARRWPRLGTLYGKHFGHADSTTPDIDRQRKPGIRACQRTEMPLANVCKIAAGPVNIRAHDRPVAPASRAALEEPVA